MAKLITKFKYLKPSARQSVGGYAKYIATREGVEKVDDTFKTDPSTEKQKKLIERILRDFPDSNSMLEYEDYLKSLHSEMLLSSSPAPWRTMQMKLSTPKHTRTTLLLALVLKGLVRMVCSLKMEFV